MQTLHFHKTIAELLTEYQSPVPLHVIPKLMGVNLSSVDYIEWDELPDKQIVNLKIELSRSDPKFSEFNGIKKDIELSELVILGKNLDYHLRDLVDKIHNIEEMITSMDDKSFIKLDKDQLSMHKWMLQRTLDSNNNAFKLICQMILEAREYPDNSICNIPIKIKYQLKKPDESNQ